MHLISLVTSGYDYIARDCHSNRQVKLHKNPGGKGGRRHADEPRTAKRRTIRRATAKGGSEPSRKPPAVFVKRLTPCNDCSHREDGRCSVRWHHCLSQGGSGGRIALRVPQLIEYCRILTITPDPFRILTITHERFNIKCTTLSVLMSTWNDTNDDACHQFYYILLFLYRSIECLYFLFPDAIYHSKFLYLNVQKKKKLSCII